LGSRWAVAQSDHARMAVATSRTDNAVRVGTSAASCSANRSSVSASRLLAMASTWAGRQRAVPPGPDGDGQVRDLAGSRSRRRGARTGHRRPVDEPGSHRGGAVELPKPGAVVRGHGRADAGVESIAQREKSQQGITVNRNPQPLDGLPQLLEHTTNRTPVRIPGQAEAPAQTPFFAPRLPRTKPGSRAAEGRRQRTLDAGAPKPSETQNRPGPPAPAGA
jgi:hypothetical protein